MDEEDRGRRIAQARAAAGKTQRELALEIDCDVGTLSRYERDALTPGVDVLVKIAKACSTSLEWLATGAGSAPVQATGT
jgi:transcriptional regulator with XRE-family HTH domain